MNRELAVRLLQTIVPGMTDEAAAARLFRELQLLADYKYNKYEMYHPGRLFLENLYLWLQQFQEIERSDALDFVRNQLIFVSRGEFQQLAQVLYNDRIRQRQFDVAAVLATLPRYRVRGIRESSEFRRVARASLYVGMSDGARLDFIRRHNLDLNNEQVLPYYAVHGGKVAECLQALRDDVGDPNAAFQCLFLVDDFAGSGNTLLREVISAPVAATWRPPVIPRDWEARLRFKGLPPLMEVTYRGPLAEADVSALMDLDSNVEYHAAVESIASRSYRRETLLKGSLQKVSTGAIAEALAPTASVWFCPLLTTDHALQRLKPLVARLPGQFSRMQIMPGAVIGSEVSITDASSKIGALCDGYYEDDFADEHTGNVKFGYDGCGLPLVLHHNTPNNSVFLLWARRGKAFYPLFVRYERHGREDH
jgi:hypothetical protein